VGGNAAPSAPSSTSRRALRVPVVESLSGVDHEAVVPVAAG